MAHPVTTRPGGTHRRAGWRPAGWRRALPVWWLALRVWWRRRVTWGKAVWRRLSLRPGVDHLIRAGERFSDRLGNQFAAAITYFSFLSLIPILMVSFSAAGFVLGSRPALLAALKGELATLLPTSLADLIDSKVIEPAVHHPLAVGVIGLLVAVYSGVNWMNHIREAVRAQWRPRWERAKGARGNVLGRYLWDLLSLLGLLIAVLITFSLTAIGSAAKDLVVRLLGVQHVGALVGVLSVGPFVVSVCADTLIFAWIYTILPYRGYRARGRTLVIGALAMSVCFEVLKAALTILVARVSSSPSGAVFGSVIGLLLFFNLVARAFLMVAAWIATGTEQPDDDDEVDLAIGAAGRDGAPASSATVLLDGGSHGRRRAGAAFGAGAMLGLVYGRWRRRRSRGRAG